MTKLYALLVGIDVYHAADRLAGCVRDVDAVEAYLTATATPGTGTDIRVLRDGAATRAAIIEAFRGHLRQAGPDDVALFWFSGHGSDAEAPGWVRGLEPTGRVQTLVCADSRSGNVPDLWDKELAVLLDEVTGRAGHVAVVLDSCHSDGASKELQEPEPVARSRSVRAARPRDPASFLPGTVERASAVPPMRHVELAACRAFEPAEEMLLDGARRGIFSWALLRSLRRLGRSATYRDLLRAVQTEVAGRARQVPQARPRASRLLDQPFLGGAVTLPDSEIWMRYTRDGWAIDAGAVHGVPAGDGARVGVHGGVACREARIIEVRPEHSLVEPVSPWQPSREQQFPVVMTSVPLPATTVALQGPGPVAELAAAIRGSARLRLLAPDSTDVPDLRVAVTDDARLVITDSLGVRLEEREHRGAYAVHDALATCGHIARWRLIRELRNDASALAAPVRVEIVDAVTGSLLEPDDRGEYVARYRRDGDGWVPSEVRIRLRNTGRTRLYCVLLGLTPRFQVHLSLFPGDFVAPGATAACMDGRRLRASLPAGTPVRSGATGRDLLKLVVAERQFPTEPYRLPMLSPQLAVLARELIPVELPPGADWTTTELILRTEVP